MEPAVPCPWATNRLLPCVLRDGNAAYADHGHCEGCDANPLEIDGERKRQRDARQEP
jgi:hypothetical protein